MPDRVGEHVVSRVHDRRAGDEAWSEVGRRRPVGLRTVAYTAATLLGGVSALVVLGLTLAEGDPSVLDVLLWGALAALMLAAAARQWWLADHSGAGTGQAGRGDSGAVDALRRLSGHDGGRGAA